MSARTSEFDVDNESAHSRMILSVSASLIIPSYLTMLGWVSRFMISTSFISWVMSSSDSPSSRILLIACIDPFVRQSERYTDPN